MAISLLQVGLQILGGHFDKTLVDEFYLYLCLILFLSQRRSENQFQTAVRKINKTSNSASRKRFLFLKIIFTICTIKSSELVS